MKRIFEQQINDSRDQYPYNTIGKIFAGANLNFADPLWTDTGVLVGPDLLLTASHTVLWVSPGGGCALFLLVSLATSPMVPRTFQTLGAITLQGPSPPTMPFANLTHLSVIASVSVAYADDNAYIGSVVDLVGYEPQTLNGQVQEVNY